MPGVRRDGEQDLSLIRACWSRGGAREDAPGAEEVPAGDVHRPLTVKGTNKRFATCSAVTFTAGICLLFFASWPLRATSLPEAGDAPPRIAWRKGEARIHGHLDRIQILKLCLSEPPYCGGRALRMPPKASFTTSASQHSSHYQPLRSFQGYVVAGASSQPASHSGSQPAQRGEGVPSKPHGSPATLKARKYKSARPSGLLPGVEHLATAPQSSHARPSLRGRGGAAGGLLAGVARTNVADKGRKDGRTDGFAHPLGPGTSRDVQPAGVAGSGRPATPPPRDPGGPSKHTHRSLNVERFRAVDPEHHGGSGGNIVEALSPNRKSSSGPAGSVEVLQTRHHPHVDTYGFFLEAYPAGSAPPPSGANAPEDSVTWGRHVKKWRRMLGSGGESFQAYYVQNPFVVKRRVRKGIPDELRGLAWLHLSGGRELQQRNRGVYIALANAECVLSSQIEKDLHRTFPNHVYFADRGGEGQQALFRVLKAYACYDPEVGYVQGMSSIAAVLLMYMCEEDAFWTFCALMTQNAKGREAVVGPGPNCRRLFVEGLPLLKTVFSRFEALLGVQTPRLATHLRDQGVDVSLYSAKWWMTLFSFTLPFSHVVRVWDMFMLEGWKAALRAGVAAMKCAEGALLGLDFEDVVQRMRPESLVGLVKSPDEFIKIALKIKTSKALKDLANH